MTRRSRENAKRRHFGSGVDAPLPRLRALAFVLMAASWLLLWTRTSYWGPLFFTGTWLGATVLISSAGPRHYPGIHRHLALAFLSVPLWWWFELVNGRVDNWEYLTASDYGAVSYALFASLAFSTVVPALDAATRLTMGSFRSDAAPSTRHSRTLAAIEMLAGAVSVSITFIAPQLFFPLVWVGPFLILDGIVLIQGGRGILAAMITGEWRIAFAVGLAGLLCGALWEFWNFWANPQWIYHLPYLDFLHIFEMPVLGYLGYIPFAWSVYQLINLPIVSRYVPSQIQEAP
jgi:hypothetical protein